MKRILIVDDDRAILDYVQRVLGRLYDVTVTQDAVEALSIAARLDRLDLVIADYVMPAITGDELVGRIHELRPEARALFLSGYPALVASQVRPVHICLRKPVPPNLLRDTVEYLVRDAAPTTSVESAAASSRSSDNRG
jgi:CheY-like chemotaxis protein